MVGVRFLFERRDGMKKWKEKPIKNAQERSERFWRQIMGKIGKH
ncbi:hypothetical protein B4143_2762 [Bacillus subtilis]|nr:hypothetical protein B4143_2762 [Bacillus subtilis]